MHGGAGSHNLSPLKKRVYNTLRLMKQMQFDRPLPWTGERLYTWLITTIKGVRFRGDINLSSCAIFHAFSASRSRTS